MREWVLGKRVQGWEGRFDPLPHSNSTLGGQGKGRAIFVADDRAKLQFLGAFPDFSDIFADAAEILATNNGNIYLFHRYVIGIEEKINQLVGEGQN